MNINQLHQNLITQMQSMPVKQSGYKDLQTYLGDTGTKQLGLKNPDLDKVTNEFYKANKDLSYDDLISLLDKLYRGEYVEEKVLASFILLKYKEHKRNLELKKIEEWLEFLNGWAQVDNLCQSGFSGEEFMERWSEWKKLIITLRESENINKQRASLVLLLKPLNDLANEQLKALAFSTIDLLKSSTDKRITKAVSWILREMIDNYRADVVEYIEKNKETLPAIALRETKKKLTTGKK